MPDTTIKSRSQELRELLNEKTEEMKRQETTWKIEVDDSGQKADVLSAEQASAYRELLDESQDLVKAIQLAEEGEGIKAFNEAPRGESIAEIINAIRGEQKGELLTPRQGLQSVGAQFLGTDECKAFIKSGGTVAQEWTVDGFGFADGFVTERKDIYTSLVTSDVNPRGFGMVERDPMVAYAKRTARVRDLFPARPTLANLIQFFRVTGYTGAASVLPERSGGAFALKPGPAGLTFDEITANVQRIAWYEAAHRDVLADEPQLQGVIDTELLYGLRLHEDYQILSGTGTGSDLLGILKTPGIQNYTLGDSGVSGEQAADAIRRGATKAFLSYYEPTGVVVHPSDWETIELIKDNQLRYIVAGSVAIGAQPQVWRMPVVQTPAIPQGTALLGAFGIAAQLYDREQSNIRIAEQHADFFLRNAIVVLAEQRLALATKRPEAFVMVDGL